jgi:hypothetical protein
MRRELVFEGCEMLVREIEIISVVKETLVRLNDGIRRGQWRVIRRDRLINDLSNS